MELAVLGILALSGYHINKNSDNSDNELSINSNNNTELFSNNNIYDSNKIKESHQYMQKKGLSNVQKSNDPTNTNIIPVNYNSNTLEKQKRKLIENDKRNNEEYIKSLEKFNDLLNTSDKKNEKKFVKEYFENINSSNNNYHIFDNKQELNNDDNENIIHTNSIESVFKDKKNLKHNNMVPFFGSNITQNLDSNRYNSNHLNTDHYKPKREKTAQHPTKNIGFVNGAPLTRDLSQYQQSRFRPDETPVDKIHIGPGIDKGYCSSGNEGFHNMYRVMDKTVDELRTTNNKKETYVNRILAGKQMNDNRSSSQIISKNQPETTFEQNQDNYFRTTGAYLKEEFYPMIRKTPKKMESTNEYVGGIGNMPKNSLSKDCTYYTEPTKNEQNSAPPSNLQGIVKRGTNNQKSYNIEPTIRSLTSSNKHSGNMSTYSKSTSHLLDTQKTTIKQTTQHNDHTGHVSGSNKNYASYQDEAKTTVKQTTEFNDHNGNLSGSNKFTAHAQDDMRTTGRQTTEFNDHNGNLAGSNKFTSHAQDDMRTTLKQTTEFNDHNGNLTGHLKHQIGQLDDLKITNKQMTVEYTREGIVKGHNKHQTILLDDVRNTQKQDLSNNEYAGIINGSDKSTARLQDEVRNTQKQELSNNEYTGGIKGKNKSTVRLQDCVKNTQKQELSNNEYYGDAKGTTKFRSRTAEENAETNDQREIISKRRDNAKQGPKTGLNPTDYNMSVNKQEYDDCCDNIRITRTLTRNDDHVRFGEVTYNDNKLNCDDRLDTSIYDAYRMNEYTIRKV